MLNDKFDKAPVQVGLRYNNHESTVTHPAWAQWFEKLFNRGLGTIIPEPPDNTNEYVLTTVGGVFAWKPSVAPAPAPDVTFGGEDTTFGGDTTKW